MGKHTLRAKCHIRAHFFTHDLCESAHMIFIHIQLFLSDNFGGISSIVHVGSARIRI